MDAPESGRGGRTGHTEQEAAHRGQDSSRTARLQKEREAGAAPAWHGPCTRCARLPAVDVDADVEAPVSPLGGRLSPNLDLKLLTSLHLLLVSGSDHIWTGTIKGVGAGLSRADPEASGSREPGARAGGRTREGRGQGRGSPGVSRGRGPITPEMPRSPCTTPAGPTQAGRPRWATSWARGQRGSPAG